MYSTARVVCAFRHVALIVMLCAGTVLQADDRARVVMAYVEFPPYSFTDTSGVPRGLSIDLARQLLRDTPYELEFRSAPNPGVMFDWLQSGDADMTSLLALTPARLGLAEATAPLGSFKSALFALRDRPEQVTGDFSGQRIGVVEASLGVTSAGEVPFAEVVQLPNFDNVLVDLMAGDVDAVIAASDSFLKQLRQMGIDPMFRVLEPPLQEWPYAFYVRPANPGLLAALDDAVETGLKDADLEKLRDLWFGTPTRLREQTLLIWGGIGSALILFAAIAAFIRSRVHSRRARVLRLQHDEYRLLMDALDGVDAAIVIYDENLKAIHWNTGFFRAFPGMIDTLERGVSMESLISASYLNGTTNERKTEAEARDFADDIVSRLKTGETVFRLVKSAEGQMFEATEFRVGQELYASVRMDVTRLHGQAELIQQQKGALEGANEKLQMFAAIAAHDLKAPLVQQGSLLQFIEEDLADAGVDTPPEVRVHLRNLSMLSRRMTHLVQDLLDHASADNRTDTAETFDPTDRMDDIIAMAGLPAGFTAQVEGPLPSVMAVATSFDTVLRNLISNAAKHHDRKTGTIRISAYAAGNKAIFEVSDDGKGVPLQDRQSIFEPFKRLSSETDGSGLGLSVIKKTVTQWGGEVHVECPDDRGSTFVFTVPLADSQIPCARNDALLEGAARMH